MNWTTAQLAEALERQGVPHDEALRRSCATDDQPVVSKYHNRKKECDGLLFDSTKEARHYLFLKAQQQAGEINGFERQVVFVLQEKMSGHRAIKIVVDFVVTGLDGRRVVHEVKTKITKTPAYRIKRKLFAAKLPGVEFLEIE